MPTPHKHAEVIRAFADGATIQVGYPTGEWVDNAYPHFDEKVQYRVKPEPAAPKWPQTTMTNKEINGAIANGPLELVSFGATETARRVINKAIEHECSTGALVPADKVREIEAKARAEGIKEGQWREWDRRNLGGVHNRVGYQGAGNYSQAQVQYAGTMNRGWPK